MHIPFLMQDGWPLCDFYEYIYTAPRLTGTTLKSKLKNLRVVRRNGRVSGLQDLVANVAFWVEGVSFQRSWATVGIVATLLVSFG